MGAFRRTIQIIWTIITLVVLLAVAASVYTIPYVTPFVESYLVDRDIPEIVVLVVLAILALLVLMMLFHAIFAKSKRSYLDIKDERGNLRIQARAVEQAALSAIDSIDGIYEADVRAKLYKKPEDTVVNAHIKVVEERDFANVGNLAQLKINQALESILGIKPKKTNVVIQEPDYQATKSNNTGRTSSPRVR